MSPLCSCRTLLPLLLACACASAAWPAGAPASLTIRPSHPVVAPGTSIVLEAVSRDGAGVVVSETPITWTCPSPRVLLTGDGKVTGLQEGDFQVTASSGALSASVTGTVVPSASDLGVSASIADCASGGTATLVVSAFAVKPLRSLDLGITFEGLDGSPVPSPQLGDPVSAPGLQCQVLGTSPGALRVRLTSSTGVSGSSTLLSLPVRAPATTQDAVYRVRLSRLDGSTSDPARVSFSHGTQRVQGSALGTAARIVLSMSTAEIRVGDVYSLTGAVLDANGSLLSQLPLTWKVASGSDVLSVDDGGRVTGLTAGRGSVVAMAAGQMATATVDVVAASVAAADAPQVVLPYVSAKPGETVSVPLMATGIRDLAGMRVDVSLAPTTPAGAPAPSVGAAVSGPIALDAAVAVNRSKPSAMGLGLLTQGAISEDGVLLYVPLTVPPNAPGNTSYPLTVTYTEVSDFEARPLPIASRNGGLAVPGEYEPPSVTLKGLVGGQFLSGTQGLQIAASDNYAVRSVSLLVDGLAAVTVAGDETTLDWDSHRVPDGSHALQLQAVDTSGNVGVSQTLSVWVDNTPPTARISSPANGSSPRLPLSVVGTASDLNLTSYQLEVLRPGAAAYVLLASGTTAKAESTLGTLGGTGLSDGQYKLRLTVLDAAGNKSASEVTVTIDATPPQVSFISPKDGMSFRDPTTVEVKATDAQGIAAVKVYLDQQTAPSATLTQSPYRWTMSVGALGDGKHVVRAEAVDSLGNSGSAQVTVLVDRQAPAIQVLTTGRPVAGGKWQLAVSLQDLSPVAYQAEAGRGAAPTQFTTLGPFAETTTGTVMLPIDLTRAPEGVDTLRLTVIDAAGNAAQVLVPIEVDNTPPVAAFVSPADGSGFSADRDVVGDAYDAGAAGGHFAGYTLEIGDSSGTWRTLAQSAASAQAGLLGTVSVSTLAPGPYQLRLTVTDQAGNSTTATRAIRVLAATAGDLDGNGQVNVGDVLVALRVTVGLIPSTPALVQAGDLVPAGGDGKITISDVIALLRLILHLS